MKNISSTIILAAYWLGYALAPGIRFGMYLSEKDKMQTGYKHSHELKLETKDLADDGKFETVFSDKSKSYLLKYIDGQPKLIPFKIESRTLTNTQTSLENKLETVAEEK